MVHTSRRVGVAHTSRYVSVCLCLCVRDSGEGGEEGEEKRFSMHARIPSQETFDFVRSAKSQVRAAGP